MVSASAFAEGYEAGLLGQRQHPYGTRHREPDISLAKNT
jgi:hypothetical protein